LSTPITFRLDKGLLGFYSNLGLMLEGYITKLEFSKGVRIQLLNYRSLLLDYTLRYRTGPCLCFSKVELSIIIVLGALLDLLKASSSRQYRENI
jgi:hypothetical protein